MIEIENIYLQPFTQRSLKLVYRLYQTLVSYAHFRRMYRVNVPM